MKADTTLKFTAAEIAKLLNGTVEGDETTVLHTFCTIDKGVVGGISFLSNPKYESNLYTTSASAVIVNSDFTPRHPVSGTLIRVPDAYAAISQLMEFYQAQRQKAAPVISTHALVEATSVLEEGVGIGPFTVVGMNCVVGKNVQIGSHVSIGDRVKIGDNTQIYAGVRIYPDTQIGDNCVIHAGVVIGSDGFGFAQQPDGSYRAIPQMGHVVIEDDVHIGANCTIDCGTFGATRIRKGVKLDNLVQVAHNVDIGEHTVIAAQTGIAGSAKIGKGCVIGGQVGIAGHITVADYTKVGGQSGVTSSVEKPGQSLNGTPAFVYRDQMKSMAVFKRLPQLRTQLEKLEQTIRTKENL